MMRSVPVEWNLFGNGTWDYAGNEAAVYEFWKEGAERTKPYEGVITIGMRGNGTYLFLSLRLLANGLLGKCYIGDCE